LRRSLAAIIPNREWKLIRCETGRASLGKGYFIRLAQQATATGRIAPTTSAVAGLARFFPEAAPVRIPIQLARTLESGNSTGANFTESTVIEFGTPHEVLFACNTPLEFADVLRLRNSDGSLDVEASVVAVQYHPGRTVVAARFKAEVPNWIVKS
jgi:hypothetical protein